LDNGIVGDKVTVEVAGFDIEDVDKDTNIGEDMLSLLREVIFHECILTIRYQHWDCRVHMGKEAQYEETSAKLEAIGLRS
jgi:hypothetical protein